MNKDQGTGILERLIYSAILAVAMKFVAWGYIDTDMATYIAVGGLAGVSSAWAWWHNRPVAVMNRAAETLPKNAELVITTTPTASPAEKVEAHAIAGAASDKVIANTTS